MSDLFGTNNCWNHKEYYWGKKAFYVFRVLPTNLQCCLYLLVFCRGRLLDHLLYRDFRFCFVNYYLLNSATCFTIKTVCLLLVLCRSLLQQKEFIWVLVCRGKSLANVPLGSCCCKLSTRIHWSIRIQTEHFLRVWIWTQGLVWLDRIQLGLEGRHDFQRKIIYTRLGSPVADLPLDRARNAVSVNGWKLSSLAWGTGDTFSRWLGLAVWNNYSDHTRCLSFLKLPKTIKWYYDQKIISFFSSDFESVFA